MTPYVHALTVDDLSFSYPGTSKRTFSELNLSIPGGAVTAILGPNGSGKTTLLHLFLGLLAPEAGHVRLFGKKRQHYSATAVRQCIGLVPQNEVVPFDLSVMEYVLLGRAPFLRLLERPGPADWRIATDALESVAMAKMATRRVTALSSGEKQLAATARALCQEPRILLMDEPTSHLDLANARRVLGMIRKNGGREKSVVFTTHDPNAAAAVADHVLLMGKNHLLASGPPSQTLTGELLSATYGQPVKVLSTSVGPVVLTMDMQA